MLKKCLTLSFLIYLSQISIGQETVFSYPMNKGNDKDFALTSLMSVNEKNKNYCVALKENNKIEFLLFSSEMKLLKKVTPANGLRSTVFQYESQSLISHFVNNEGFNFIFSVRDKSLFEGEPHVRLMTVNFEKNEVSSKKFFIIEDPERTIQYFVDGNKYYHLTVNDKTDELMVYVINEDGIKEKKKLKFDLKSFYNVKKLSLSSYFLHSGSYYPSQEIGLKEGTDLSKFMVSPGKLTISVTNDKEPPHIITLDLNTFVLTKKKLVMDGFCGYGSKESFYNNSYIFEKNMYVINVCKDIIEIGVFNPETGLLIRKHAIPESDETFFSDASLSRSKDEKEKEKNIKAKELIKRMMKSSLSIAVAQNANGNIVLTCGTYNEQNVSGGGYYAGGFSTVSTTSGPANAPVVRSSQQFDGNKNWVKSEGYKATTISSFRLVLSAKDANLLTAEPLRSKYDVTKEYIENYRLDAKSRYFLFYDNKLYFTCYDAEKKEFVIQKLEDYK